MPKNPKNTKEAVIGTFTTMSRTTRLRSRSAATEATRHVKKDESEKEELDTYGLVEEANGRPYQLIEGLPCSMEVPQYSSTLTHALSVKDSAVLYTSMLSSRRTWINSEMFDMLWSKQYLNAKEKERLVKEGIDPETIDASAAREKMHKLCDCYMVGGPHTFPIRLFILKNDDIERQWNEAQEQKKRDKEERKKRELEEKKKRQEERKQQQWMRKQEKQQQKESSTSKKTPNKEKSKKNSTSQASAEKPRSQTPQQKKPPPQSAEDQKMITNLNLMAQKDPDLNSLMVIVAGGRATAQQVEDFKKYIEKARKMPAPTGWKPISPAKAKTKNNDKKPSKNTVENQEELDARQTLEKAPVKVEDPSQLSRETTPGTTSTTSEQPRQKRKYTKRKKVDKPEPEDKSMQLTTFQQKYMHSADIVFEYAENPNKRFSLPKDAILEKLEDEESYLMSWIVVHNKKEIFKYEERVKKKHQKELAKKHAMTDPTNNSEIDENDPSEGSYDVFADPQSPVPLYTPMTVKFTNISKKFTPIIMNSVQSVETTQKLMSKIIERGTKLSGYNLWFQLDAYDDGELAESLRYDLREYEQGFKNKRLKKQL